jgi:hypothetical protein
MSEVLLFTFGQAISHMQAGNKMARQGWNGRGMYTMLQIPDEHSKMNLPYFYMFTAQGQNVPWVASHSDMLATDWYIVEEAKSGD